MCDRNLYWISDHNIDVGFANVSKEAEEVLVSRADLS